MGGVKSKGEHIGLIICFSIMIYMMSYSYFTLSLSKTLERKINDVESVKKDRGKLPQSMARELEQMNQDINEAQIETEKFSTNMKFALKGFTPLDQFEMLSELEVLIAEKAEESGVSLIHNQAQESKIGKGAPESIANYRRPQRKYMLASSFYELNKFILSLSMMEERIAILQVYTTKTEDSSSTLKTELTLAY